MARPPPAVPDRVQYHDFQDFQVTLRRKGPPDGWVTMSTGAEKTVLWNEELGMRVEVDSVGNCFLVVSLNSLCQYLYDDIIITLLQKDQRRAAYPYSFEATSLKSLLNDVSCKPLCPGLVSIVEAIQPQEFQEYSVNRDGVCWPVSCAVILTGNSVLCAECQLHEKKLRGRRTRKEAAMSRPLNKFTPLKTAAQTKLVETVKSQRQVDNLISYLILNINFSFPQAIRQMKKKLLSFRKSHVELQEEAHSHLLSAVENAGRSGPVTPFMRLFWEEQKKMFARKEQGKTDLSGIFIQLFVLCYLGHRWHPMMLRMALLIHSQSPAAYHSLRKTGVLKLPGETTLRQYTNAIHPEVGFNPHVMEEIRKAACKSQQES